MVAPFCAVASGALPPALLERIAADLDAVVSLQEKAPAGADSSGSFTAGSFWRALGAAPSTAEGEAAANAIEEAALHLARHSAALRAMLNGATPRGFEWWWQEHEPNEAPKGLHTDKCAALEPSGSAELRVVEAHPLVSSVLYLSDHGGPTAVFDQTLEQAGQCGARDDAPTGAVPRPDAAAQVLVCAPERGRLLLFDGRLLHAVLHRPGGVAHGLRRTLLVNWWADRPPGVADAPRDFSCACTDAATVASPRAHVPERAQRPTVVPLHAAARAAAPVERFFADVRDHWIAQRAPCEVAQAYASSERAGRAPILLALYDGGGDERDEGGVPAPAAAAPGVGPDARIAWVVARRGLALSTTDSATSARELRAIWPP